MDQVLKWHSMTRADMPETGRGDPWLGQKVHFVRSRSVWENKRTTLGY
jgi:hypothetical protein